MARIDYLDRPEVMNHKVAHHRETQAAVRAAALGLEIKARANLAAARAASTHQKIKGPDHLTRITMSRADGKYGRIDFFVNMIAPNPMAIEYGHFPSGYFDPKKYGKVTKAPHGLYILSGAAGYGGQTTISSGRKRGKI